MVALSRDAGARVILLPMEIPPNYGARYTSAFRDTYATVAEQGDTLLAPFILEGIATDPELMQPDGIHPTAEAQPLMLENVLPTVLQALGRS
jgi:acyl-CoA thioesterase-1